MIKDTIKNTIQQALENLNISADVEVELEHPAELAHGDYASNVAMRLASEFGDNPRSIAEKIISELEQDLPEEIASVDVAGPGFINFHLSPTFFTESLQTILAEADAFGAEDLFASRKTIFEYTTQNLMKEFHVGHLMSHVIGHAIANIYAAEGAEVKRNSYQGDVGMHIAKVVWAIQQDAGSAFPTAETPAEKARYLGQKYAAGDETFTTDEQAKTEIETINQHIYAQDDRQINELYEKACKWSRESYQDLYDRLGVKLDWQFYESETAPVGKKIVEDGLEGGIFEQNDGAVIYRGDEEAGLHTRVFINSAGIPTYETKDLGLMQLKHDAYPYDESVIFTANEQNEYFKVVLAAAAEAIPRLAEKNTHIGHGMLELADGKMSSRTGDVLSADVLLNIVKERAADKIAERLEGEVKDATAESVAQAAIRYSILKQDAGKNVVFDTAQALSFEGNSGPYLQYTYARCRSLLGKAADQSIATEVTERPEEITDVERLLYRFPEVLQRAAEHYAPHLIATYLHELARHFNTLYGNTQIVTEDAEAGYRLALTATTAQVLENGLDLLGIDAPEEM